jgi:hypothetical protein
LQEKKVVDEMTMNDNGKEEDDESEENKSIHKWVIDRASTRKDKWEDQLVNA